MSDSDLDTASKVMDALGGNSAVARLTGSKPKAVSNWRARGFPPRTFASLNAALAKIGLSAPAKLWDMGDVLEGAS